MCLGLPATDRWGHFVGLKVQYAEFRVIQGPNYLNLRIVYFFSLPKNHPFISTEDASKS